MYCLCRRFGNELSRAASFSSSDNTDLRFRQPPGRQRARAGIGYLPLSDVTVDVTHRNLQRARPSGTTPTTDADTVGRYLLDLHLRKIRNDIGLDILRGVVHLVEQLLLAGPRR